MAKDIWEKYWLKLYEDSFPCNASFHIVHWRTCLFISINVVYLFHYIPTFWLNSIKKNLKLECFVSWRKEKEIRYQNARAKESKERRGLRMRSTGGAFENRGGPSDIHSVHQYYLFAAVVVVREMWPLRNLLVVTCHSCPVRIPSFAILWIVITISNVSKRDVIAIYETSYQVSCKNKVV